MNFKKQIQSGAMVYFNLCIIMMFMIAGMTMNFLVIDTNHNKMPVLTEDYINNEDYFSITSLSQARYGWMGDVISIGDYAWLSIGDIIMFGCIFTLVFLTTKSLKSYVTIKLRQKSSFLLT